MEVKDAIISRESKEPTPRLTAEGGFPIVIDYEGITHPSQLY
ncbi:hypothetical protein [Paenibacillus albiflavus]|nr:hypothetical protein [Paenibacillus albiflavus]